jgi:hypothetical protein
MGTMRAITRQGYGDAGVLRLEDVPRPRVRPAQVLVHAHAAGLDRGTEHLMTGTPYAVRLAVGQRRDEDKLAAKPAGLSYAEAAVVPISGDRVTGDRVTGDRVTGVRVIGGRVLGPRRAGRRRGAGEILGGPVTGVMSMTLRCLLRGHRWGPPEGAGRSLFHTCSYCGRTKHLPGEPRAERHDKKGGYP